jgi:hypothetical protein
MMDYQKISHGSPEWESLLQRQGVNLLLLSAGGQAPLIEQLKSSPDWCGHYRDPYAVIYARCDPIP